MIVLLANTDRLASQSAGPLPLGEPLLLCPCTGSQKLHCLIFEATSLWLQGQDALIQDDMPRMSPQLVGIASEWKLRINMLYSLLQSNKLQGSQRAPSLRQFLLRLNFNGFQERETAHHVQRAQQTL